MLLTKIFIGYLILINLIAFFVSGWDKRCAIRGKHRVPERTLLLLACLLGSVGLMVSFFIFRHKIRKVKFMLGVPVIMVLEGLLLWFLLH